MVWVLQVGLGLRSFGGLKVKVGDVMVWVLGGGAWSEDGNGHC